MEHVLINPETGKKIKVGGATHKRLIQKGALDRDTADINKIPIYKNSRQTMPLVELQQMKTSTQWLNIKEICNAIQCSEFEMLGWFAKHFDMMRIFYGSKRTLVIFPEKEFFIQDCVNEFVKRVKWNKDFNQ